MKDGLLSIAMVSYNHGPYLAEAIQSVISQTYKNWELIIIDDGSDDNTLEIAAGYTQKFPNQIKLFTHPDRRNLGIAASYSLGLSLCQGEFIGFLEPDDIWTYANAEIKINSLLSRGIGLVYSNVKAIGEPDAISMRDSCLRLFPSTLANVPFEAFSRLLIVNFVPSFSTVIARKEVFQNLKFISNKKYAIWLDWFVWMQVSLRTQFLFIPLKLVDWRLYKQSYCNQFVARSGLIGRIIFDLRYRFMVLKVLILSCEGDSRKKSKVGMLCLFTMAYIKRVFGFFRSNIVKA